MKCGHKLALMVVSANARIWQELFAVASMKISWERVVAASVLAVAIHVLVWICAPRTLEFFERLSPEPTPLTLAHPENLEIPEELLPEEFRKNPQFVPVNPNAPEKVPPKNTVNESAADQRAAQENPDPTSRDRTPTNDGELENSRGIAENVLPRELLPPLPSDSDTPPMRELQLAKEIPSASDTPPNMTEMKDDTADGKTPKERGIEAPENENGAVEIGVPSGSDTPPTTEETASTEEEGIPDPQPRTAPTPPPGLKTLTMKSNTATNEIGVVSLDAQYSEFGEYTQRMLEAIQAAWYVTCQRSEVHARGVVGVRFSLGSDGTIRSVEILQASAPEIAVYACQDAIESRAPYEEWGPEMIERFGDEQSTTIWFHYR